MSGLPGGNGFGLGSTQEPDDRVEPAMPGVQLNIPSMDASQQAQKAMQNERLGSLLQPAANERAHALGGSGMQLHQAVMQAAGNIPGQSSSQQAQQYAVLQQMLQQQQQALQQQQLQAALASGQQQITPQQLQTLQMMMMLQRNQQILQQTAQQQLLVSQPSAAAQYLQQYQLAAAMAARGGGEPPAKRQAIDVNQQAQALANQQFRQMHAAGGLSHMTQAQQTALYQTLHARIRQQLGLPAMGYNTPRGNMRVSVDKRNKSAGDRLFHAEDTTGKDHADEVVRRCEEISKALRDRLGKGTKDEEGRFGGTDFDSQVAVSQMQMIEACGDTARYLKPYQIVGINFLMLLYRTQVGGAILADEMGLGKTAQLITYLGCISSLDNDPGPHLVVVPASLLENWQRELRRWCPKIKSVVYYGKHRLVVRKRLNDLREKLQRGEAVDDDLADLQDADVLAEAAASERLAEAELLAHRDRHDDDPLGLGILHESDDEFDVKRANIPENSAQAAVLPPEAPPPRWDFNAPLAAAPFNVMLTSYTLFERDSPDQRADREFLESWRWSHLIMDEAHALKNRNAQRTTRLRRVANTSRRRIMMTGTPLQNDLMELQNLMHFLLPRVFAAQGFENFATMLQGDDREVQRLTDRMKQLLGPFVLRRLKTEVAGQLTEKKHSTEFIEMSEQQKAMYEASLASMRSQITAKAEATVAEDGKEAVEKFMKTLGAKKINHMFTHLRKIAQHPLLVRHHYDDASVHQIAAKAVNMKLFSGNANLKRVTEELLSYSDYSLHAFCYNSGPEFASFRLNATHLMTSAKFGFLAELLPKLKAAGSRPLIFSQWTAVLDVIEWLMDELRLPYVRLDGSTAVDERLATVDRFNTSDDVFAFLLSTRAGGQGLNLTGADTVILHDVDFNPQIDRQAEDRCHRLGQTKPVAVYRLVTKNSVDHNIYNLSQRKLKLDHAVLDGITTGRGARQKEAAAERQQMGYILHSLFAGKDDEYEVIANAGPDDVDKAQREAEAEKKKVKEQQQERMKNEENGAAGASGLDTAAAAAAAVKAEDAVTVASERKEDQQKPPAPLENGNSHHHSEPMMKDQEAFTEPPLPAARPPVAAEIEHQPSLVAAAPSSAMVASNTYDVSMAQAETTPAVEKGEELGSGPTLDSLADARLNNASLKVKLKMPAAVEPELVQQAAAAVQPPAAAPVEGQPVAEMALEGPQACDTAAASVEEQPVSAFAAAATDGAPPAAFGQ